MKITADTNLLVRAIIKDDARQYVAAAEVLRSAELVVISAPALCEFAWVASRAYGLRAEEVASAIRLLISGDSVEADWGATQAGLTMLDSGGDFADGVIAYQGRQQGAETFVTFDRKAARLLQAQGEPAQLLA